jgi:hypothetical protein
VRTFLLRCCISEEPPETNFNWTIWTLKCIHADIMSLSPANYIFDFHGVLHGHCLRYRFIRFLQLPWPVWLFPRLPGPSQRNLVDPFLCGGCLWRFRRRRFPCVGLIDALHRELDHWCTHWWWWSLSLEFLAHVSSNWSWTSQEQRECSMRICRKVTFKAYH